MQTESDNNADFGPNAWYLRGDVQLVGGGDSFLLSSFTNSPEKTGCHQKATAGQSGQGLYPDHVNVITSLPRNATEIVAASVDEVGQINDIGQADATITVDIDLEQRIRPAA